MPDFKDHPTKKLIRMAWCKELIAYVHETLKRRYKFLYLGLPGQYLLDVTEWLDYIDQVIAFQCRDYPNPSSVSQPRDKVAEMERQLQGLERANRIGTFSLYDGYIEEVILRGRDIAGNIFTQSDVVTIYNLDFCNNITSPLSVYDEKGKILSFYKSHAIKKLLEIQRDISTSSRSKKFIMFLTVHADFSDKEIQTFIKQPESAYLKDYLKKARTLKEKEKRIRFLKAYILDIIRNYFSHCNFSCYLLPPIYYQGTSSHKLITFTIIGALDAGIGKTYHLQDANEFLRMPFLTAQDGKLTQYFKNDLEDIEIKNINPSDLIKDTEYFRKLWQ